MVHALERTLWRSFLWASLDIKRHEPLVVLVRGCFGSHKWKRKEFVPLFSVALPERDSLWNVLPSTTTTLRCCSTAFGISGVVDAGVKYGSIRSVIFSPRFSLLTYCNFWTTLIQWAQGDLWAWSKIVWRIVAFFQNKGKWEIHESRNIK